LSPEATASYDSRRISRSRSKKQLDEQTIQTFLKNTSPVFNFAMYIFESGEAETGSAEEQPVEE
jgi:hypothetical protein